MVYRIQERKNLTSATDLNKRYGGLRVGFFNKLSKENKEKIFPPLRNDWSELKGLSEEELVNWFINFKKEKDISTIKQFRTKFNALYSMHFVKLSEENREKVFPPEHNKWFKDLKDLTEDELVVWIMDFNEKHGITSATEFCEKFSGLARHYYSKLSNKNKNKIFSTARNNRSQRNHDWSELENLNEEELIEWFINFRKKKNINHAGEFIKTYTGVCKYYSKLSKESRRKIFPPLRNDWSFLKKLSEEELIEWIIEFKEEKKLTSPRQLCEKYGYIYAGFFLKLSKENREKIFPLIKSYGEKTLGELLTNKGYLFTTQKDFPDLKSNRGFPLYYDVFIPKKNCIIEFHGGQHFNPNCSWYSDELIERDKIKYQYAIDHGITIIYITDCIEAYKKYGYFTEVLTDWDKLIESINSLPDVIVDAEDTAQN